MLKKVIFFVLFLSTTSIVARNDKKESLELLKSVLSIINTNYVDALESDSLTYAAIQGMVSYLDPHSQFLSPKENKVFFDKIQSQKVGVGVYYRILYDTLTVVRVIPNSPAEKAGLLPNDKIIKVDNHWMIDTCLTNKQVFKYLGGKQNSTVDVTYWRPSQGNFNNSQKKVSIQRDWIPQKSVNSYFMINASVGYIAIDSFNRNTGEEFKNALLFLKQKGMKQLVLDLRNNGGGFFYEALKVAGQFLQKDELIVSVKDNKGNIKSYRDQVEGLFESGELVVLINEHSASASEVVAGALQDQERAILVGRRSFGKGLVQNAFPLKDGSALLLTIQRYYSPSGRSIQKPFNRHVPFKDYKQEIESRFNNGELFNEKQWDTNDVNVFYTLKNQRKKVYSHGGISPDIFIPLDSSLVTNHLYVAERKQAVLQEVVTDYYLTHREILLDTYLSYEDFHSQFNSEYILNRLYEQIQDMNIEYTRKDKKQCDVYFSREIKAILAGLIYEDFRYTIQERNTYDTMILQAVSLLSNK